MESVKEEKHHGFTIKIYQDEEPESPREWDNFGKMICFHKDYELGDKHSMSAEDLKAKVDEKGVVSLPLYLLDHSGIWMNTTGFSHVDPQRWDWGQVGYIYADADMIRKNWNVKRVTPALLKRAKALLASEVERPLTSTSPALCTGTLSRTPRAIIRTPAGVSTRSLTKFSRKQNL